MDELDRDVRRHVYFSVVANGRPPTTAETAAALGRNDEEVAASYRRLHDAHALVLFPGAIDVWMANPFCFAPTPHRVEAGGRTWTGTCCWDALGIPAALHADGRIATVCACCGDGLTLVVSEGEVVEGADLLVPRPRACPALVGRHRLHLKHDGLPPVGGAPRTLARFERLGARRHRFDAADERARPCVVGDATRSRLAPTSARAVAGDPRVRRALRRLLVASLEARAGALAGTRHARSRLRRPWRDRSSPPSSSSSAARRSSGSSD